MQLIKRIAIRDIKIDQFPNGDIVFYIGNVFAGFDTHAYTHYDSKDKRYVANYDIQPAKELVEMLHEYINKAEADLQKEQAELR